MSIAHRYALIQACDVLEYTSFRADNFEGVLSGSLPSPSALAVTSSSDPRNSPTDAVTNTALDGQVEVSWLVIVSGPVSC